MKKQRIAGALSLSGLLVLLLFSQNAAEGVRAGLSLCGRVLIPSLFPFLVLSAAAGPYLPRKAGLAPFFLGFAAGYPMGVRYICKACEDGQISRTEARRQLFFCCNCGCGFLVGTLGAGLFGSGKTGLFLLAVQIVSAGLLGLLSLRLFPSDRSKSAEPLPPCSFFRAAEDAVSSMLRICGLCLVFSALCGVLSPFFSHLPLWGQILCRGCLELSQGVAAGAAGELCPMTLSLLSGVAGFGGLCVHAQSFAELSRAGLSGKSYLLGKLLQGLFSFLLCLLFSSLFSFCW